MEQSNTSAGYAASVKAKRVVTIMAANDGGHLMQLHSMRHRLPTDNEIVWVTTRTPQSESLLDGENVHWVGAATTRDRSAVVANAVKVRKLLRQRKISAAFSTGSSIALSTLPLARLHGASAHYIESATRLDGPSLSGKILERVPGVTCYTQHSSWQSDRWKYAGSVFDGFSAHNRPDGAPQLRRVVVSLGTSQTFGFRRLIDKLVAILPKDAEIVWQTGSTDLSGLDFANTRPFMPSAELQRSIEQSDLVVAHAGTGIALTSLRAGKLPLLVPRDPLHREHIDDHQAQIAGLLSGLELCVARRVDELTTEDLHSAARQFVTLKADVAPMGLL